MFDPPKSAEQPQYIPTGAKKKKVRGMVALADDGDMLDTGAPLKSSNTKMKESKAMAAPA